MMLSRSPSHCSNYHTQVTQRNLRKTINIVWGGCYRSTFWWIWYSMSTPRHPYSTLAILRFFLYNTTITSHNEIRNHLNNTNLLTSEALSSVPAARRNRHRRSSPSPRSLRGIFIGESYPLRSSSTLFNYQLFPLLTTPYHSKMF